MGEWSLPADEGRPFSDVLHADIAEGRPEPRWMRGGFWRNFQVKYREINDLHKQMLRASAAVEALPEGPVRDRATDHLYQGQSNDCYWHGCSAASTSSHMRLATLEHLIAAQDAADRAGREQGLPVDGIAAIDADLDGVARAGRRRARPVGGHQAVRGRGHRLLGHPRRRHALLSVASPPARGVPRRSSSRSRQPVGRPRSQARARRSIHDIVKVREPGLAARLDYDRHERRSGLVHILATDATAGASTDASARASWATSWREPFEVDHVTADEVALAREGSIGDRGRRAR